MDYNVLFCFLLGIIYPPSSFSNSLFLQSIFTTSPILLMREDIADVLVHRPNSDQNSIGVLGDCARFFVLYQKILS